MTSRLSQIASGHAMSELSAITRLLADLGDPYHYPRELSWLSFTARVLQEAQSADVPLIQRVRYLGSFSSNVDEFFRVRVAEVRRRGIFLINEK